jgi:hypothetical protein
MDVQPIAYLRKDYAVISDTQSASTGEFSFQLFDVAAPGVTELYQLLKYAHRRALVQAADIGAGLGGPFNRWSPSLVFQREIVRRQAKVGKNI